MYTLNTIVLFYTNYISEPEYQLLTLFVMYTVFIYACN